MTGRELIMYILENGLENEEIFKDGKIVGYMTIDQAAIKTKFGRATIEAWIDIGVINNVICIGHEVLIPENAVMKAIGEC